MISDFETGIRLRDNKNYKGYDIMLAHRRSSDRFLKGNHREQEENKWQENGIRKE